MNNLIDIQKNSQQIINKEDLLMRQLTNYFGNQTNLNIMLPIIKGESNISLRILDWFITNYSKKRTVYYKCDENDFRVHTDYKSQLKAYSKKQFDPFCRRERILFHYDGTNSVITTVGQLNFFRWAISNSIISYINENICDIEKDMIESTKKSIEEKRITNNKIKKKTNKHLIDITVTFD